MNENNKELECIKFLKEANKIGEEIFKINKKFEYELNKILQSGKKKEITNINNLEKEFLEFIDNNLIGQERAKKAVARSIINLNKIGKKEGVLSALFFAGPTGVGKTEMAKLLAEFLTGDRENIIIIQGAEYQESHKISNLFGSPKGYVGYGDAPILSETKLFSKKITKPHEIIKDKENFAIILIDEAEKMHPAIIQGLLGALNEGKVRLSTGKEENPKIKYSNETDLRNTIWIFTSNVGAFEVKKESENKGIGFLEQNHDINANKIYKKEFEKYFSPEFRGRLDHFIIFDNLQEKDIDKIIDLKIRKVNDLLIEQAYDNLEIRLTTKLKNYVKENSNKELGARNIVKLMNKIIDNKLAELNTVNIIETAVISGIKNNKKVIFTFDLKDNHQEFEYEYDKIKIYIHGEEYDKIIANSTKQLVKLYEDNINPLTSLEDFLDLVKYHEGTYGILNTIKNSFKNIFINREKFDNFNDKVIKLEKLIKNSLGELDLLSLKLLSYITLTKETLSNIKAGIIDLDDIIESYKIIQMLAKLLNQNEEIFKSYIKNKLKMNKSRRNNNLKKPLDNLINNIEPGLKFTKKEKVIAKTLMQLEEEYFLLKGKYLGEKIIKKIIIYLNEVY